MVKRSIDACGMDPGSVYFGFGRTSLEGMVELVDKNGAVIKRVPDIKIQAAERWNLKLRLVYSRGEKNTLSVKGLKRKRDAEDVDKLHCWVTTLTDFIDECTAIHQEYDSLLDEDGALAMAVTENQCDMAKSAYQKFENSVLSYTFMTTIRAMDHANKRQRQNEFGGKKYNIPQDGSIGKGLADKDKRQLHKIRAVIVLKELLFELGLTDWLSWFVQMEEEGEQIHDICDALLLAIQISLNKADIKRDMTQKKALANFPRVVLPVRQLQAPSPDSVAELTRRNVAEEARIMVRLEKTKRKRDDDEPVPDKGVKKPRKTPPKRKRIDLTEEETDSDKPVAKKTRKTSPKRKLTDESGPATAPKKMRKTKMAEQELEERYPKLLFERVLQ